MIGNCIVAMMALPLVSEFLTFFCPYFRGSIRSDRSVRVFSRNIRPRVFRFGIFVLIFLVFYPFLSHVVTSHFSMFDPGYLISYMCFLELIEPTIIHLNGDKNARLRAKPDPEELLLSTHARIVLMLLIIVVAVCGRKILCWLAF